MITFLTATPGGGKSLLATEILYKISKANVLNLKHNYFYAKSFFEKIAELKLEQYFQSIIIEVGQGLEKTSQHIFLEDDYFDFLKTEYYINVVMDGFTDDIIQNYPPYYFERVSIILNEIIKKINKEENTKFLPFKPVRTLYTNIANLRLSQARPLPENMDWRLTPQGSYFVVDEAQLIDIFSEESKKIDPIVKDLTIHRHKGYDFLFITQDPSFVHKYIRKLASLHIHLVNIFGWEQSMRMEWSTVQEVPNAARSLIRAENVSRWVFPKHVYKLYQSTTIDTRVKRIPKKLVTLVVFAVLLFIAAFFVSGGQSTVLSAFSGKPLETEEVKKNEPTKPTNPSQPSGSAAQPVPVSGIANNTQAEQSLPASGAIPSDPLNPLGVSNASESGITTNSQPNYDPEDPYSFKPVSSPAVVNHRIFAGCFCVQKKCYATDQQGTKLAGISGKTCREVLDKSSNRPFDYFRQPPVNAGLFQQPSQQPTEQAAQDQRYLEILKEIAYMEGQQRSKQAQEAQVKAEPLPHDYKPPREITGANAL